MTTIEAPGLTGAAAAAVEAARDHLLGLHNVHLPSAGIPVERLKEKFPELKAGVSVHTLEDALQAEQKGADYVEKGFGYDGTGKLLLGFLNFDYDNGATFYIDEIAVTNAEGETAFAYDFSGNDGDAWDPEAFGDELFS